MKFSLDFQLSGHEIWKADALHPLPRNVRLMDACHPDTTEELSSIKRTFFNQDPKPLNFCSAVGWGTQAGSRTATTAKRMKTRCIPTHRPGARSQPDLWNHHCSYWKRHTRTWFSQCTCPFQDQKLYGRRHKNGMSHISGLSRSHVSDDSLQAPTC